MIANLRCAGCFVRLMELSRTTCYRSLRAGCSAAGNGGKTALSPKMRAQAAAVAAELSARTPAEGVTDTASLTCEDGTEEGLPPVSESAVHLNSRHKTAGSSR